MKIDSRRLFRPNGFDISNFSSLRSYQIDSYRFCGIIYRVMAWNDRCWYTRSDMSPEVESESWRLLMPRLSFIVGLFVIISLLSTVGALSAWASSPYKIEWVKQFGTPESDRAQAIATDAFGSIYVGGWTGGSLAGPTIGGDDGFLVKLDPEGNFLWQRQFGSITTDYVFGVAVGPSGDIHVTGNTYGDFYAANLGTESDVFVSRWNTSGELVWGTQFGSEVMDYGFAIVVDGLDQIFVAGTTWGTLGTSSYGGGDAYLAQLDASGNLVSALQFGTPEWDQAYGLTVDTDGRVIVAGSTQGQIAGSINSNNGDWDPFVVAIEVGAPSYPLWTTQFGGTGSDYADAVVVDTQGHIYVVGFTTGSEIGDVQFGGTDAFLVKLDRAGDIVWTRQMGGISNDHAHSIAVDHEGNLFVAGYGFLDEAFSPIGTGPCFLIKLNPDGDILWAQQFGESHTYYPDRAYALAVDPLGNVYVAGETGGSFAAPSTGRWDAFVIKFAVPEPASHLLLLFCTIVCACRRCQRDISRSFGTTTRVSHRAGRNSGSA
ncbi:MAG: SBBP repeat-containing protein [Phycisphaeraceae bacterium]|nr:SBBP repeat-containing protein [Phycisphaeraceae bacterium]